MSGSDKIEEGLVVCFGWLEINERGDDIADADAEWNDSDGACFQMAVGKQE